MDFLQIALIFLILLLSIFLSITGIQVFFILRDLKKALDKLNEGNLPSYGSKILKISEKPVTAAGNLVNTITHGAKVIGSVVKKPKPKRFYRKVL